MCNSAWAVLLAATHFNDSCGGDQHRDSEPFYRVVEVFGKDAIAIVKQVFVSLFTLARINALVSLRSTWQREAERFRHGAAVLFERRAAPGVMPNTRLNARLKAASES